ncbi:MAG: hypothetical protein LBF32_04815, partial [Streptococcaceae bacterium]|nr:hypothetical protein [Streptococcaceae bacterium]
DEHFRGNTNFLRLCFEIFGTFSKSIDIFLCISTTLEKYFTFSKKIKKAMFSILGIIALYSIKIFSRYFRRIVPKEYVKIC